MSRARWKRRRSARWPIGARLPARCSRAAGARQRHQPRRGGDQTHRLAGGGVRQRADRARPGGREYAGEEPDLPGWGDAAGVVVGARVPIILTSRADSLTARIASCAVAALVAAARRGTPSLRLEPSEGNCVLDTRIALGWIRNRRIPDPAEARVAPGDAMQMKAQFLTGISLFAMAACTQQAPTSSSEGALSVPTTVAGSASNTTTAFDGNYRGLSTR